MANVGEWRAKRWPEQTAIKSNGVKSNGGNGSETSQNRLK